MSSRAHARRRLAAWERYRRRYPGHRVSDADFRWINRAGRHRPTRHGGAR